jgi:hypothetical protein
VAILSALQSAALRLMGQRPTTFFGSTGQFEMELCDLVNEVAQDIAKYQDWQALVRIGTVTGDGETAEFALPADYDRMLVDSEVADLSSWFWGFGSYTDINAFLYAEARGFTGFPGGWIIYGDRLRFSPAPEAAQTATFPYITKNWATGSNTATKGAFDADDDAFALPERLLTLGLVWRWRENKKLDASGDQEAFVKALEEYATKDGGSWVFRRSSRRRFPGTYPAWPWELGPATYTV